MERCVRVCEAGSVPPLTSVQARLPRAAAVCALRRRARCSGCGGA